MERSAFFNSNQGDRVYDASDFAMYFGQLVSNGVFYATPDNLLASPGNGMAVAVAPGSAWIGGCCYINTEPRELPLAVAHGANPRVDRIVVRWSLVERAMRLAVLTGATSAQPTAPALTRANDTYELGIADVLVPAGSVGVQAAHITDTRTNDALCGLVNSRVAAVYQ
jgi:hypothetical protein